MTMSTTPQQPWQPPAYAHAPEPRNGLGIAALCLGIAGLLIGIIPILGLIGLGLGTTGVILALSARGRLKRGRATNKGTTWTGFGLSLAAVALGIGSTIYAFAVLDELDEDLTCIDEAKTAKQIDACSN